MNKMKPAKINFNKTSNRFVWKMCGIDNKQIIVRWDDLLMKYISLNSA